MSDVSESASKWVSGKTNARTTNSHSPAYPFTHSLLATE
jgi:hypothetical protein